MKVRDESLEVDLRPKRHTRPGLPKKLSRGFALTLLVLFAGFALPLWQLAVFAYGSEVFSYILLIPVVSLYVAWIKLPELPPAASPARGSARFFLGLGVSVIGVFGALRLNGWHLPSADSLAITTVAFLAFFVGTCAWFMSPALLRALAFPLGFLVFTIPIPTPALTAVETFMQHGSAAVAHVLFEAAGNAVFYEQLTFQLPGIALHVAPECSGIRSTLALFIVSIVTGYFFLRSPAHRALLAVAIVPLALVRNGFRIFTIGELCVRVGPEMIDSFIHRRGGPVFFALSLVPLFLLLVLLQRRERPAPRPTP